MARWAAIRELWKLLRMWMLQAEVHRFEHRLFVVTDWGGSWGAAVPAGAEAEELGALVRQALRRSKRDSEPIFMLSEAREERRERRKEKAWERFCRDVVGIPVERYRPEIRVDICQDAETLHVRPLLPGARPDEKAEIALPAGAEAKTIGEAVLRLLAETPPAWPIVRRATLASEAHGGLVLFPERGRSYAGPVRVLPADVEAATLAVAVRAALDESDATDQSSPNEFERALQAVGIDPRDLTGGAHAVVAETTQGTLTVEPWKPDGDGWIPAGSPETDVGDVDAAAAAALAMVRRIRKRHRKPGAETGTSFGYKTAWLAVRGDSSSSVVDAVGLTGIRTLPWEEGVAASHEDGVFVTPPTRGWVLAVGHGWFGNEPDVAALSAGLGTEVQYFATHRVVEAHTWALARDGALVRHVSYVGESDELDQRGEPTEVEQKLGLAALTDVTAGERISEETVMKVAAGWSLDPQQLSTTPTTGRLGTHGFPATRPDHGT